MPEERRVFISYSRVDREFVAAIVAELKATGTLYVLDEKDIDWGDHVESAIRGSIRDSSHLLVVISPASAKSTWVPYEIGLAQGYGLTILPLLTHPSMELFPFLRSLNYKTDIASIRGYFGSPATAKGATRRNPKPFGIGDLLAQDMYMMVGNHTSAIPLTARYRHTLLEYPIDVRPDLEELRRITAQRTLELGVQYFNGPNTRLIRFTEEGNRQLGDGSELKELTLELGPVSWEEYTLLNTFLDYPLSVGGTMRDRYADREELFRNDRDMSWCPLSGILSLGITPITADGYGLVQKRNPRGVSSEGGRYTSGLAENIHRYLDEAPVGDMHRRLHPLGLPVEVFKAGTVDVNYCPQGAPSPYLAAHRGIWEEISESLALELPVTAIDFLNLGFELTKFQPVLVGIVDLGLSRHEVERRIRVSPGRDHSEFLELLYLPLDHREPETARLLREPSRWVTGGLAALISAIHYWRQKQTRSPSAPPRHS